MAIYHCSIKIGSRSKGQSAIASSAYRSGTKLTDKETGQTSDYTRKGGVCFCEVSLCANAPQEYMNREILWNEVHKIEKAKNSQLWREIEVALPKELTRQEQIETVREFVKVLTNRGMCADWALHDKGDGNPHAHIMLTTRSIEPDGKWAVKSRKVYDLDENGERIFQKINSLGRKQYKCHKEDYNDWNARERVEEWRAYWAECCNKRLSELNQIDHRSYARRGIDQVPTIHEGYTARKIVASGGSSPSVSLNAEIRNSNRLLNQYNDELKLIDEEIRQLKEEIEKGSAVNAGKQRLADLLARRNRTVTQSVGGIADGERTIPSREQAFAIPDERPTVSDTGNLIRQSELERRTAISSAGVTEVEHREQKAEHETVSSGAEPAGASTEDVIRKARIILDDSEVRTESAATNRAERDVERKRLADEESRRIEEQAERERKALEERSKKISRGGFER